MATRQVLAELVAAFDSPHEVVLESVGGVDAARRVRAGEAFDAVVLAADVIDQLIGEGRIVAGSRVDLVRSGVSMAVRAGAPRPDIGSEDAVRRAVLAASTVSYSTGPSGAHLARLFERWGIVDAVKSRIVQAPPGVPVGTLVAEGKVELGFQQLSELMHLEGDRCGGTASPGDPDRHHVLGRRRRDVDATRSGAHTAHLHGIARRRRGEAAKRDGAGVKRGGRVSATHGFVVLMHPCRSGISASAAIALFNHGSRGAHWPRGQAARRWSRLRRDGATNERRRASEASQGPKGASPSD